MAYYCSSWMSEAFARENEALTKALQISLSDDSSASETLSSVTSHLRPPQPPAAATTNPDSFRSTVIIGGRRRNPIPCSPSGKITRRKSRASKRSPTTYINTDPANFRRLVQEVTGIRFVEAEVPVEVVRPEAQRTGMGRAFLPTLDTSARLLDRAGIVGPDVGTCGSFGPVADGPVFDFEALPNFPTLESWGM